MSGGLHLRINIILRTESKKRNKRTGDTQKRDLNKMIQPKPNSSSRHCLLIILFLSLFNTGLKAQEIIDPPVAKHLTTFSFELLSGGIIIVHARLDNFPDTLNFILDTGSGGISLDSTTTEHFKLKKVPTDKTIRGIGGIKTVEFVMGHTLNLPTLEVKDLDFHINDYTLLTSVYGLKIDGIIGYSFLRRYIVSVNYDDSVISVYSPGVFKYPRGGHLLKPSFTSIPMQPVTVRDGKVITDKFYFDSGAGLCFLLSEDFARDSTILVKNKRMLATQAEGLGGKRPMKLTVLKWVKIGPYKFRKVPTYVFKDEFNVTAYPNTGGLIGNDLLRRFNVVLNYPEQSIYLKPNRNFDHPFDYSYTGLGIYMEDGDIVVDDVIRNSPGEKAGFKAGDVILAVDNNFSHNIQIYRTLLQNSDARIKVLVIRDGESRILTLDVRNILRKR